MATENKMQWLIDLHNSGEAEYEIQNTCRNHGAISKPTGSGKSALFINDIIYRILHRGEKKLMINISTPIIKLCEQQGNDFMETIEGIAEYYNINLKEISYFILNSGNTKAYNKNTSVSLESFNKASFEQKFINHPQRKVAIIINCHPSLSERMIPWLENNNTDNLDIVTYIDEAHTVSSKIVNDQYEGETTLKLDTLCKKSKVYLISATNKQELVKIVNLYDNINDDSFIINETPADAISANKICAPHIHIKQTTTGELDGNVLEDFMKMIKSDGRIHKVLVTCSDTKELKELNNEMKSRGYTVFSTCSKSGMNGDGLNDLDMENSTKDYKGDVIEFIKAINNCETDCFIFHIRQMISGIDVGSISDVIVAKNDTNNFNNYSNLIQTIGRSLRLGNERGDDISVRSKKYANCLIVTKEDNETVYADIEYFLTSYYGLGHFEFHIGNAGKKYNGGDKEDIELGWNTMFTPACTGDTINYWENVKANIKRYLIEKVKPIVDKSKEIGLPVKKCIEDGINEIEKKYNESLNGIYLLKYIQNKDLRNEIDKLTVEVGIC